MPWTSWCCRVSRSGSTGTSRCPSPDGSVFPWPGLLRAPVLVLPYVSPQGYVDRYAEADKSDTGLGDGAERWSVPYWWVDGGAAVMALLLAAEAAGLGALLFGQFDHEPTLAAHLGVPEGRRALGTVALGHPGAGDRRSAVRPVEVAPILSTGSTSARGRPPPRQVRERHPDRSTSQHLAGRTSFTSS